MAKLSYATVGSNDLDRAKSFYDSLFDSVGVSGLFDHPSGGRIYGKDGKLMFGVLGPYNQEPASNGNGSMFAFEFETPEEVAEFHARALSLGGTDEGAPGPRGPGAHFAYFRDLDGNKLCAFSIPQG